MPYGILTKLRSPLAALLRNRGRITSRQLAIQNSSASTEHLYDNNVFGEEGIGTHYVVLVHELNLEHVPSGLNREDSPGAIYEGFRLFIDQSKQKTLYAPPAARHSRPAAWRHSGRSRESTSPRSPPYWH